MQNKRALISVSDKTGVVGFAQSLVDCGYEVISTGGTQKALQKAGVPVVGVEEVTQFPECFSGRVKTMHPLIMGGVLFRRDDAEHQSQAQELGIGSIDMVVVNLYPFEETVAKGITGPDLIEQIDIGGPTLLRSAAKNFNDVTVICDTSDYDRVIEELQQNGDTSLTLRQQLSVKVFERTAAYDAAITETLSGGEKQLVSLTNKLELRYGENPHQPGAFYELYGQGTPWNIIQEEKKMSYLNILDADGAWNLIQEFEEPTAACIKHANPSGVGTAATIEEAFQKSYDADRLSAFGVIVSLNTPCSAGVIQKIIDQSIFAEVLIAPSFTPEAVELLKQKSKIRAIEMRDKRQETRDESKKRGGQTFRSMLGGMLVQNEDDRIITQDDLTVVTENAPNDEQIADLLFAWKVVKHAKSNAIVFAKNMATVGIGCGQTSRVDSTWIAAKRAGDQAEGAVMASDAFFPFADSIEEAAKHGISAIIQPGGSIRDEEVIAKANELGIAMVTTGVRAFKH